MYHVCIKLNSNNINNYNVLKTAINTNFISLSPRVLLTLSSIMFYDVLWNNKIVSVRIVQHVRTRARTYTFERTTQANFKHINKQANNNKKK